MQYTLPARTALVGTGLLLVAGMMAYTYFVDGIDVLRKYEPDLSASGLARSAVCGFAALLVVLGLRPGARDRRAIAWNEFPYPASAIALGIAAMLLSAYGITYHPWSVIGFVWDGDPLSIATDIGFAAALVLLAWCAWRSRAASGPRLFGFRPTLVLWLMFAAVFLILMEEMSWGQHLMGFSTPEAFSENLQNETNLHNFYTYRFETAYYSVAVLAFVLLPYAWPRRVPAFLDGATQFVPPRAFALAALPLCGFVFMTWNYAVNQFWLFAGLIVAADFFLNAPKRVHRMLAGAVGATMVLSQVVYLRFGHQLFVGPLPRNGHELTEIREFMIVLAILAYSIILARRTAAMTVDLGGRNSAGVPA